MPANPRRSPSKRNSAGRQSTTQSNATQIISNRPMNADASNSPSSSSHDAAVDDESKEKTNPKKRPRGKVGIDHSKTGKGKKEKKKSIPAKQQSPSNKRRKEDAPTHPPHYGSTNNVEAGVEAEPEAELPCSNEKNLHRGAGKNHFKNPPKNRTGKSEQAETENNLMAQENALRMQLDLAETEKANLRIRLEVHEATIETQREIISQIHAQCSCTICLELAFRPHVLSPCGHVFCARCLVMWFKKPQPDEQPVPEYLVPRDRQEEETRRTLRRKKICPHCRERVQSRPAEVWMIKGLIDKIDESVRLGQGKEEHDGKAEGAEVPNEALKQGTEVWDNIFPLNDRPIQRPIYDDEDQVYRCGECAREIVDGICTNPYCGMEYSDEELNDFYVHGDHSDIGDLDLLYGSDMSVSGDEDWDEEDHQFIDDGAIVVEDDSEDEVEFDHHLHREWNPEGHDSDGDDGEVEVVAINERNPGPRRNRNRRFIALSDSEDDDDRLLNVANAFSPPDHHFSDNDEHNDAEADDEEGEQEEDDNAEEEEGSQNSEMYENSSDVEEDESGSEGYSDWNEDDV